MIDAAEIEPEESQVSGNTLKTIDDSWKQHVEESGIDKWLPIQTQEFALLNFYFRPNAFRLAGLLVASRHGLTCILVKPTPREPALAEPAVHRLDRTTLVEIATARF